MVSQVLHVVAGSAEGERISPDGELLLGRSAQGHGQLGGDPEISRRHARITSDPGGQLVIEDLGSTNGTYVNGARIGDTRSLVPGDVIKVGRTTLEVRTADGQESKREPPSTGDPAPATEPVPQSTDPPLRKADDPGGESPPAQPIEQAGSPSAIGERPALPTSTPPSADVLHGGVRVPVSPQGLAIGRDPESDLVVDTEQTSRKHARIGTREGRYFLADLNSANGTYLNGEHLRGDSRWLNAGDTVAIGGDSLRFLTGQATRFGVAPAPTVGTRPVTFDGKRLRIGRDPANDVVLEDPNVSRFHAEVVASDGGVELLDLGSRNGTRVDGQPATRTALGTGSEIGVGPFRLVFDGTSFLQRDDRGALRLNVDDLTVSVHGKVILNRASIDVEPGELVVIIGESGSGKSTLIKALAGVIRPSKGSVAVNGEPVASRLTDIGYVPQDEIVHGRLTPLEALRYSAKLRLPRDSSKGDIEAAVQRVLDELSLTEHANTRIGSLSGGQRKRVGMAAELLNRPSLLFLDEPTTGLDPGLETQMMELFRELAEPGTRAVAVVTHATKNLDLADKICMMGRGGEICFFGTPGDAKAFFEVDTYDGIYTALDQRPASDWRREFEARRELEPATAKSDAAAAPRGFGDAPAPSARRRTGPQASILAQRYLKLLARDRRNLFILLGQVPAIALGIALVFQSGVLAFPGRPSDAAQLLFLLATTAVWLGSIDGSRELIKEKALSLREAAIGVKPSAYLFSKAVVLFGLVAVQTLLLTLIVFAIRPLEESVAVHLAVVGTLMITGFVAVGMGLLISGSVNSEDQATSFIPLALIPQLLFAGAIVTVQSMGEPMASLSNLVFARWSFASLGSSIDMNERIAGDPQLTMAYGDSFFDLSPAGGTVVLLAFLVVLFGAVLVLLHRRNA